MIKVFAHAVLVICLCGLMGAVEGQNGTGDARHHGSAVLLGMGFVLLAAWSVGSVAARARLPRLTGYMATGIVCGPFVLAYLDGGVVSGLSQVNGVAVALIALTAGSEIDVRELRPLMRWIAAISAIAVVGSAVLLTITTFALRDQIAFLAPLPLGEVAALAAVIGVVVASGSPAVVVAIRAETQADGPLSRTVLGVVVLADLVVIVLFALASSVARAMAEGTVDADATIRGLAWELFGSIGVGIAIGILLAAAVKLLKGEGAGLFVLAVSLVAAEVAHVVHLDPLLMMLAAGMFVQNAVGAGGHLREAYESMSLPVFVLFFTVVGASIRLDVLPAVAVPALVLAVVRGGALWGGTRVASRLVGAPATVRDWAGFGLLPQAGLANALAILVARTFPGYGEPMSALLLGIVAVNAVLTPALFRLAVVRAGEVPPATPAPA